MVSTALRSFSSLELNGVYSACIITRKLSLSELREPAYFAYFPPKPWLEQIYVRLRVLNVGRELASTFKCTSRVVLSLKVWVVLCRMGHMNGRL